MPPHPLTAEFALAILNNRLLAECLNDLQETVFIQTWQGKSYGEMANALGYDESYIRDVGAKLWKQISAAVGERVTKQNVYSVLAQYVDLDPGTDILTGLGQTRPAQPESAQLESAQSESSEQAEQALSLASTVELGSPYSVVKRSPAAVLGGARSLPRLRVDWGEAVDSSAFWGRTDLLVLLENWVQADACRLIALLGMGGMGKTSLAVKLVEQLLVRGEDGGESGDEAREQSRGRSEGQPTFSCMIWRSLRNAPPLTTLLIDLIQFLSNYQENSASLPTDTAGLTQKLMHYLRQSRCLVVLDNAETLLGKENTPGQNAVPDPGFGELLRQLGEIRHQSCILLTSREKSPEIAMLEGNDYPVRSLLLKGLTPQEGQAIFQHRGDFTGSASDWQIVIEKYAGNPLALKIVACAIEELFNCDLTAFVEFLQTQTLIFDDIRDLLDRQFERLTAAAVSKPVPLQCFIVLYLTANRCIGSCHS